MRHLVKLAIAFTFVMANPLPLAAAPVVVSDLSPLTTSFYTFNNSSGLVTNTLRFVDGAIDPTTNQVALQFVSTTTVASDVPYPWYNVEALFLFSAELVPGCTAQELFLHLGCGGAQWSMPDLSGLATANCCGQDIPTGSGIAPLLPYWYRADVQCLRGATCTSVYDFLLEPHPTLFPFQQTLIEDVFPMAGWVSVTHSDRLDTTYSLAQSAVPEPATLSLLGLGLAGIGFVMRRKAGR